MRKRKGHDITDAANKSPLPKHAKHAKRSGSSLPFGHWDMVLQRTIPSIVGLSEIHHIVVEYLPKQLLMQYPEGQTSDNALAVHDGKGKIVVIGRGGYDIAIANSFYTLDLSVPDSEWEIVDGAQLPQYMECNGNNVATILNRELYVYGYWRYTAVSFHRTSMIRWNHVKNTWQESEHPPAGQRWRLCNTVFRGTWYWFNESNAFAFDPIRQEWNHLCSIPKRVEDYTELNAFAFNWRDGMLLVHTNGGCIYYSPGSNKCVVPPWPRIVNTLARPLTIMSDIIIAKCETTDRFWYLDLTEITTPLVTQEPSKESQKLLAWQHGSLFFGHDDVHVHNYNQYITL